MHRAPHLMLLLFVLAMLPSAAHADPESTLNWDDCVLGGRVADKTDACDSNTGLNKLVVGVRPNGVIHDVNGVQGTIRLEVSGPNLPSYWQLQAGGARQGKLSVDVEIGNGSPPFGCPRTWGNIPGALGGANLGFSGSDTPNSARLTFISAIPATVSLDSGTSSEFSAIALNISRDGTTTTSGCALPACFSMLQLRLTKPTGTPGGDVFICPTQQSFVTWQGGGSLLCPNFDPGQVMCPIPTPVGTPTWGMIKQMYR